MDREHQRIKGEVTSETTNQIKDTNEHLKKTKEKNDIHSRDFEKDVKEVEVSQRRIFDDFLREVLDDFKGCKTNVSEKINGQIGLIKDETREMDGLQHAKIDEEIKLFTDEVATMDTSQHQSIDNQIKLFTDEIA